MKSFPFASAKLHKLRDHLSAHLGPLELDVMEMIWQRGESSVRDIHQAFSERLAYTTLMTTLDRLHKKGWLERRKDGRAFLYSPCFSPNELEHGVVRRAIDSLLGRGTHSVEPLLACIVDAVTEHDHELLDELDRLIQAKRRRLEERD